MSFPVTFSGGADFRVKFSESAELKAIFTPVIVVHDADYFEGDYEYTPTQAEQTIPIQGKTATQDIIIQPIPSNYGLITWDGSVLTVS